MNKQIKRDVRTVKYHQRGIRNGEITKCKNWARRDITEIENRNYVGEEYLVLLLCSLPKQVTLLPL